MPIARDPSRYSRWSIASRAFRVGASGHDARELGRYVRMWIVVSDARLLLTCGLPAAGKTRLARQLAADRNALRLTQDEWLIALGSTPWDASTREKLDHELWRLAQEVLRLGLSVVLDFGLWAKIERDEMRSVARALGVGVELRYLDVPTDELWRRIQARNSEAPWNSYPIGRADFEEWLRIFQAPDAAELALFDPPL
jgi:predicted kinase